jgi:hypothetical protein
VIKIHPDEAMSSEAISKISDDVLIEVTKEIEADKVEASLGG